MIESLHLKDVATYDNSGVLIQDLKKINFIYGSNGSGKTTVTKYLYEPTAKAYRNCSMKWKDGLPVNVLVYNKDFRDRNFGEGNINGVFTLGQATKDDIDIIEKKKAERDIIKTDGTNKVAVLEKQKQEKLNKDSEFKEDVWFTIYKKHEDVFKEAFKGFMIKESFKEKILTEFAQNTSQILTYEQLKKLSKTIFGKTPVNMPAITGFEYEVLLRIEEGMIWKKIIIGKADVAIASLIQRLNLNDWVNEGRKYLSKEDRTCPFCQEKTISTGFKQQLEDYFDEGFLADTLIVKSQSEEYNRHATNIINILNTIETNEKSNSLTKLDVTTFSAYLKTLNSQFQHNRELLNNKLKEPSRSIALVETKQQIENIVKLIADANIQVNAYNLIVTNYAKERASLIRRIWRYLVEEDNVKIGAFTKAQKGLQAGIENLETQVKKLRENHKELNTEIRVLSKNVTSVQPSIDQINLTLTSYGFYNFSIVASAIEANKCQVQREDGTIATATLSEGEITFITFLYFLQIAKGSVNEDNVSDDRILIVDDPISSLDSNVLFVISTLLKQIIKDIKAGTGIIKQLILLTHNVYFHKEVSFIDGRTKECNDTSYWILRRNDNISQVQAFFMKNPIKSSYELLWMEIRNSKNNSALTIQNTMRRIIENYFKILGGFKDDRGIILKFPNHQEQEICRSLLCWINDGSHTIPDDLFIEKMDETVDKYMAVFKNIFVHSNHEEHYKMMMRESEAV